ncbi:uncharacterized protein LOC113780241 [Coffea eugenioides]|uniref:uncharacterized protein LOC113780241 n=1 Tax=Coffea eugenioides TaxID=49369 RepID=UPI000F60F9C6|nr:uncharacterized protein LOC113780241 [Coffea eugenioides]
MPAASNFKDWLDCFLKLQGNELAELTVVTMWRLWKSTNQALFEGKVGDAIQVGKQAKAFLKEYWKIHRRQGTQQYKEHTKWVAPEPSYLKINVDGAFSEEAAGVGLVVRNHLGQVEAAMAARVDGAHSAEHVECLAFLTALEFARDFGISHFLLEGDALNIVQRINSKEPDLSLLGNLIHGIRSMLLSFDFVKVSHVRRTNNVPAHIMAKFSLSFEGSRVWFVDFPKPVADAALVDLQ